MEADEGRKQNRRTTQKYINEYTAPFCLAFATGARGGGGTARQLHQSQQPSRLATAQVADQKRPASTERSTYPRFPIAMVRWGSTGKIVVNFDRAINRNRTKRQPYTQRGRASFLPPVNADRSELRPGPPGDKLQNQQRRGREGRESGASLCNAAVDNTKAPTTKRNKQLPNGHNKIVYIARGPLKKNVVSCLYIFLACLVLSFLFFPFLFSLFRFLVFSFLSFIFFSFLCFFSPIDLRLSCVCVVTGTTCDIYVVVFLGWQAV